MAEGLYSRDSIRKMKLKQGGEARCQLKPLSSLLSFSAKPLAQQLLGRLASPRQAVTEKQEEAKAEVATSA